MSKPLAESDVLFRQRLLKASGFDPGVLDGVWGPKTARADEACEAAAEALRDELGMFDVRSEAQIATLHIKAQRAARRFLGKALTFPASVRLLSGTRSYAEQDALYAKGRFPNGGKKVTNAKGGRSNHNFGVAWDVGLFENGAYLTGASAREQDLYRALAAATADAEIEWGGGWKSFPDLPHYELRTGKPLVTVRALFERGEPYV